MRKKDDYSSSIECFKQAREVLSATHRITPRISDRAQDFLSLATIKVLHDYRISEPMSHVSLIPNIPDDLSLFDWAKEAGFPNDDLYSVDNVDCEEASVLDITARLAVKRALT